MKLQLQDSLILSNTNPTLRDISYGEVVLYQKRYLMRLKPTQMLLNSTLITDVLNRSDCIVCNIETGSVYIMQGSKEVEKLATAFSVLKKG